VPRYVWNRQLGILDGVAAVDLVLDVASRRPVPDTAIGTAVRLIGEGWSMLSVAHLF